MVYLIKEILSGKHDRTLKLNSKDKRLFRKFNKGIDDYIVLASITMSNHGKEHFIIIYKNIYPYLTTGCRIGGYKSRKAIDKMRCVLVHEYIHLALELIGYGESDWDTLDERLGISEW